MVDNVIQTDGGTINISQKDGATIAGVLQQNNGSLQIQQEGGRNRIGRIVQEEIIS